MTRAEKQTIIAEIGRAGGVMMTMYALIRDMGIANMVDDDKNGKLGDVLGDTMHGLNGIIDIINADGGWEDDDEVD